MAKRNPSVLSNYRFERSRVSSLVDQGHMHLTPRIVVALGIALIAPRLIAADLSASAIRDATRLADCMKAFDAVCTISLTYTKILEQYGISREQLDQGLVDMYQKMKLIGAKFSRLELASPWPPFVARGKTYIFIPYDMVVVAPGQDTLSKAFFIGVLDESGASWKFMDGQSATDDNIGRMNPGYAGATLPKVSIMQSAPH